MDAKAMCVHVPSADEPDSLEYGERQQQEGGRRLVGHKGEE